ncbi:hypothetical protein EDB81DRAFT_191620 [Dactylonectria macrodidyma]|uniref:Secreted protein n=1 Tax=Dactylonectria macrodidyma TaxID=307937 RepID=A0A9P9JM41_9HYPO|nr:hypothetical protein EDB81DRAFT_191620 [Dactylonectria macrodidyma]
MRLAPIGRIGSPTLATLLMFLDPCFSAPRSMLVEIITLYAPCTPCVTLIGLSAWGRSLPAKKSSFSPLCRARANHHHFIV